MTSPKVGGFYNQRMPVGFLMDHVHTYSMHHLIAMAII